MLIRIRLLRPLNPRDDLGPFYFIITTKKVLLYLLQKRNSKHDCKKLENMWKSIEQCLSNKQPINLSYYYCCYYKSFILQL